MSKASEILYFDRYEGSIKSEAVYGEKCLRWAYESAPGRAMLEIAIKRLWFSRLYGKWADSAASKKEVASFIEKFQVDVSEFRELVESFHTFNEFFYRRLKSESRPVVSGENEIAFPADGRHFYIGNLSEESHLYAKGQKFDLPALLGNADLATKYRGGTAVLSRLCPTDYHRFHFPADGTPSPATRINGPLYSVNPIALARSFRYLWENKRQVTEVSGSPAGDYLFLEVGATNVGGIVLTSESGVPVSKGDEKGYFRFGGSMVITLFREGSFFAAADLTKHSAEGREIYAKMGDLMGTVRS